MKKDVQATVSRWWSKKDYASVGRTPGRISGDFGRRDRHKRNPPVSTAVGAGVNHLPGCFLGKRGLEEELRDGTGRLLGAKPGKEGNSAQSAPSIEGG